MVHSQAYGSLENSFRGACIYDYIYFIKSFFYYYEKGKYRDKVGSDLFTYFTLGDITVFNLSSNTNSNTIQKLKNLFTSNKDRLLQGDNPFSGGAPKKIPPPLSLNESNSNNSLGKKTPRTNNANSPNRPSSKRSLNSELLSESFLSLKNTPPHPQQNQFQNAKLKLSNNYSKNEFSKINFKNIVTSGKQSNMMVSSDYNYYFKKYSSKQPAQTKKNLEN